VTARIVFAGTPEFAVPSLTALIHAGHQVVAVYTQPDRPSGRGRKLTSSPVKQAAVAFGLPVMQPETLRDPAAQATLRALQPDLMVVVAYGLLLPPGVLETPGLGCVNVHASLLPRWRGAAPIQRAIRAGDAETGVTIMRMERGLDTGPMYLTRVTPIAARETAGSLHDRLCILGAEALMEAMPGILSGSLQPSPQDDAQANYASKLNKDEALIDWSVPATTIDRQIRAFDPWPVAETHLDGATLRVWAAESVAGPLGPGSPPRNTAPKRAAEVGAPAPGMIVATSKAGIDVATGDGLLRITCVQLPGKRPIAAAQLLNARSLAGHTLG
jgi:methionyl-tRNA formyltransferase